MPTDLGCTFTPAARSDIERLLPVMREFYAVEHLHWNEPALRDALDTLLDAPRLGRLLLIEPPGDRRDGELVGYVMLGFCFSLEFGGRYGLLDELFVRPTYRGTGLAKRALAEAEALCRHDGLAAIRLEVDDDNARARGIYERRGYHAHPRRLMTRWLEED